ncbi:MAG: polysaccharide biosynthesis tyrosine autokinase [Arenicella sp.]|nr:polysaccharide biosynthesis tyrosine autokinase [Arenicella sp.]
MSQRIDDLKVALDDSQQSLQSFLIAEDMLASTQGNQITNSELQTLNNEYNSAVANRDELAKRYGARHPRMTEANAKVAAVKSRLDRKSSQIAGSRVKVSELGRLERDVARNQELYDAFLTKFREADLSSSGTRLASARIVDRALPPGYPVYPQKQRIVFLWTIGGMLLGIGLAFLREQLDTTFKGARQLEEKMGLPLFGVLQTMDADLEQVETYYINNKRSVFSESINHIRTGVMYSDVDNPPKVVLISSSVQSEGKTTLASNLALAYAQLGPTLLIDADLRRPRIKHIIKSKTKFGLVDFVAGTVPLKECVEQNTLETNLYVLNSGTTPPNPLELLASDKFQRTLDTLKDRFSYIVIDSAPVLPASDAIVLGKMADALLLAVQV